MRSAGKIERQPTRPFFFTRMFCTKEAAATDLVWLEILYIILFVQVLFLKFGFKTIIWATLVSLLNAFGFLLKMRLQTVNWIMFMHITRNEVLLF